jgi:hypothetical protein
VGSEREELFISWSRRWSDETAPRIRCRSIVTVVTCVIPLSGQQLTTTSIVTAIVFAGTTIVTAGLASGEPWSPPRLTDMPGAGIIGLVNLIGAAARDTVRQPLRCRDDGRRGKHRRDEMRTSFHLSPRLHLKRPDPRNSCQVVCGGSGWGNGPG